MYIDTYPLRILLNTCPSMYPVLRDHSIHRNIQKLSAHQREGRPVARMVSPGAINMEPRGYGRAYE